jgi:hypothetical protein
MLESYLVLVSTEQCFLFGPVGVLEAKCRAHERTDMPEIFWVKHFWELYPSNVRGTYTFGPYLPRHAEQLNSCPFFSLVQPAAASPNHEVCLQATGIVRRGA